MPEDDPNANDDEMVIRKTLTSLDVQKKAMENEADAILLDLTSPPAEGVEPMGLDTPLVDNDGYPRGDIDVYRARYLRNRFRVLRTDYKEMVEKIENLLVQLAALKDPSKKKAEAKEKALRVALKPKPKYCALAGKWVVSNFDGTVSGINGGDKILFANLSHNRNISDIMNPSTISTSSARADNSLATIPLVLDSSPIVVETTVPVPRIPFAKVDEVSEDSPAKEAGMMVGDLITRFGLLDTNNHDHLRAVAVLVSEIAGDGGNIQVTILRGCQHEVGGNNTPTPNLLESDFGDETQWRKHVLSLRPRPFSGRGLLGCHIIPFHS